MTLHPGLTAADILYSDSDDGEEAIGTFTVHMYMHTYTHACVFSFSQDSLASRNIYLLQLCVFSIHCSKRHVIYYFGVMYKNVYRDVYKYRLFPSPSEV